MTRSLVIRDVVHGYIALDGEDRLLLNTKLVQRLRFVRQNDVGHLVFPSMNTTRLEHSVGVLHVAGLLAENALTAATATDRKKYFRELFKAIPPAHRPPKVTSLERSFCRAARWYGLLHDIGHLPYSHLVEHCIEDRLPPRADLKPKVTTLYPGTDFKKVHEAAGEEIVKTDAEIRQALANDPPAAWMVERLVASKDANPKVLQPFKDILDSDVDADRIDATYRDGLLSGGDIGRYDIERLEQSTVLRQHNGEWRIFFTTRAVNAIESILIERFKTYRWLHYHPKVVAFKNAFQHCFRHLPINPEDWHARHYVRDDGFLDDAFVRNMIATTLAGTQPEHLRRARKAFLFRTNDARSLWKRRDDFCSLSERFVKELPDPPEDHEVRALYLNRFKSAARSIEEKLLADLPVSMRDDVRIVVKALDFKAFEESQWEKTIGEFHILKHSDHSHAPLRLTSESHLVRSLRDAAAAEPGIGVTVIGDPDRAHQDELERLFLHALHSIGTPVA